MGGRPAETGAGVAGAAAFLICKLAGVEDQTTLLSVTVLVGFVPTAITWAVNKWRKPQPEGEPPA